MMWDPYWDPEFEIGIETGREPLFGRLYVAGVILPKDVELFHHDWMKDSKQIKSRKKMRLNFKCFIVRVIINMLVRSYAKKNRKL